MNHIEKENKDPYSKNPNIKFRKFVYDPMNCDFI